MSEHTPGPWVMEVDERACFHDGNRVSIISVTKDGAEEIMQTIAEVWPGDNNCDVKDGRLIAASPDQHAALVAVDSWLTDYGYDPGDAENEGLAGLHAQVRAAIAKATGEDESA